jgi:hypothetical protein
MTSADLLYCFAAVLAFCLVGILVDYFHQRGSRSDISNAEDADSEPPTDA